MLTNGLTIIGERMFYMWGVTMPKLQSITIPSTVTSIGSQAFAYINSLNCVYWVGNVVIYSPGDIFSSSPSAHPCQYTNPTFEPTYITPSISPSFNPFAESTNTLVSITTKSPTNQKKIKSKNNNKKSYRHNSKYSSDMKSKASKYEGVAIHANLKLEVSK